MCPIGHGLAFVGLIRSQARNETSYARTHHFPPLSNPCPWYAPPKILPVGLNVSVFSKNGPVLDKVRWLVDSLQI